MCSDCKFFIYDQSTGTSDCLKSEVMEEEEFQIFYGDDREGCPYKETTHNEWEE